ncbi:unnamed protein product, partial [marine sediment metagenome]
MVAPVEAEWKPKVDLVEHAPRATSESNPEVDELITEATALFSTKPSRIIDARDRLNEALSMPMNGRQRAFVKKKLSGLANKWLFSRTIFE